MNKPAHSIKNIDSITVFLIFEPRFSLAIIISMVYNISPTALARVANITNIIEFIE